jgi:hypothetical protein
MRSIRQPAARVLALCAACVLLIASGPPAGVHAQSGATGDTAVRRVLDDYIGLYRKDALDRWKTLFLPGFTATFTNDDESVTTRTLNDFYERQRVAFDRTPMSETLENVRILRMGRLANVFADFTFTSGGTPRHGQLMLLMIEDKGQLKIAALAFTYHLE